MVIEDDLVKHITDKLFVDVDNQLYKLKIIYASLHKSKPKKNDIISHVEKVKRKLLSCVSSEPDESISKIDTEWSSSNTLTPTNERDKRTRIKPRKSTVKSLFIKRTKKKFTIAMPFGRPNKETYMSLMKHNNNKSSSNKCGWFTSYLSPEECRKAFELLCDILKNPIQSEWTRIKLDKQMVELLTKVTLCIQELTKDNQEVLVMNVVRSEMFEDAMFTVNVETKTISHTLIFFKDERMPLVVPIYDGGYINQKDDMDRQQNT